MLLSQLATQDTGFHVCLAVPYLENLHVFCPSLILLRLSLNLI